jgi:hypothetical protein
MTIRLDLNVRELNDIYYALGMLLADGTKETIGFAPRKEFDDLQDKIFKYTVALNKRIEEQCESDLLDHNLGFKSSYIQHGNY